MLSTIRCKACGISFQVESDYSDVRGTCPNRRCRQPYVLTFGGQPSRLGGESAMQRNVASTQLLAALFAPPNRRLLFLGGVAASLPGLVLAIVAAWWLNHDSVRSLQPVVAARPIQSEDRAPVNRVARQTVSRSPAAFEQATDDAPRPPGRAMTTDMPGAAEFGLAPRPGGDLGDEPLVAPSEGRGPRPEISEKPTLNLADLIQLIEPSVVRVNVTTDRSGAFGSGFIVDARGTIVTNYHVVEHARQAEVMFRDGTTTPVLGFRKLEPRKDLAILSVAAPAGKLQPVSLAAAPPRKGETVAAFGAPLGFSFTASNGIVSAIRPGEDLNADLRQLLRSDFGHEPHMTWIQTTAPISQGNSGGPLVNLQGQVVAVDTLGFDELRGQNLNFAVSASDVRQTLDNCDESLLPLSAASARAPVGPRRLTDGPNSPDSHALLREARQIRVAVQLSSDEPLPDAAAKYAKQARELLDRQGWTVVESDGPDVAVLVCNARLAQLPRRAGGVGLRFNALVVGKLNPPGEAAQPRVLWQDNQFNRSTAVAPAQRRSAYERLIKNAITEACKHLAESRRREVQPAG